MKSVMATPSSKQLGGEPPKAASASSIGSVTSAVSEDNALCAKLAVFLHEGGKNPAHAGALIDLLARLTAKGSAALASSNAAVPTPSENDGGGAAPGSHESHMSKELFGRFAAEEKARASQGDAEDFAVKNDDQLSASFVRKLLRPSRVERSVNTDVALYVAVPLHKTADGVHRLVLHDDEHFVLATVVTAAAVASAALLTRGTLVMLEKWYLLRGVHPSAGVADTRTLTHIRIIVGVLSPVDGALRLRQPTSAITHPNLRELQASPKNVKRKHESPVKKGSPLRSMKKTAARRATPEVPRTSKSKSRGMIGGVVGVDLFGAITSDTDKDSESMEVEDGVNNIGEDAGSDDSTNDGGGGGDDGGDESGGEEESDGECDGGCSMLGNEFDVCVAISSPPTDDPAELLEMLESTPNFGSDETVDGDNLTARNKRFLHYYWYATQIYGRKAGQRMTHARCVECAVRDFFPYT